MGLSSEIPSDDLQAKPRRVIVLSSRHRLPGQTTKPEWQGQGGEIRMLRSDNFLSIAGWSTRCWARIDRSCSASSRRWPNDPPHLRRPVGGARLRAAARRSRAQPRFAVGRPAQGIPECRLELPSRVCRRRRSQGSQDGLGRSNSKLVIVPSSSPRGLSYSLLAAAGFPSMTYCYRPLEAGALDSSLRGQRFMVAVGVAERRDSRNPGLRGDARRRKGAPHTGRRCVARSRRPEQLVLSRSTNQRFSDQSEK